MRSKDFTYNGRKLQVRATLDGDVWKLAVFENGVMRNPRPMAIPVEMTQDAEAQSSAPDLIGAVMDLIIEEVSSGRLDRPKSN